MRQNPVQRKQVVDGPKVADEVGSTVVELFELVGNRLCIGEAEDEWVEIVCWEDVECPDNSEVHVNCVGVGRVDDFGEWEVQHDLHRINHAPNEVEGELKNPVEDVVTG